jgi:methylglutaconyl-CoA hydratase
MADSVLLEVDAGACTARVVLNRPERRNALDSRLVAELKAALRAADADDRVRVIALTGAGPDFCAGADLRELQATVEAGPEASLADAESLGELFTLPRLLDKPVVAGVRGRALAGGCGLATACDLVIASREARFGYPEVKLGFVPAMVMAILRRSVGEKRAFELIALGDMIDAPAAASYGLVNRVLPEESFDQDLAEYVTRLARRSASALALSKRLLYDIDGASFEESIRQGARVNVEARMTDDCREGVRRFLDRSDG